MHIERTHWEPGKADLKHSTLRPSLKNWDFKDEENTFKASKQKNPTPLQEQKNYTWHQDFENNIQSK